LEKDMLPHVDRAFSALIEDLDERGMLDSTLVVLMGEMGRTPRVNNDAGRDHWSMAQSVVFAGGGVKPGQALGATDKMAAYPTTEPVSVPDLVHTPGRGRSPVPWSGRRPSCRSRRAPVPA